MPQALVHTQVTCPYCYSEMSTQVDISTGMQQQQYYEDCEVCCAPMELQIHINDQGEISRVEVKRGNG